MIVEEEINLMSGSPRAKVYSVAARLLVSRPRQ